LKKAPDYDVESYFWSPANGKGKSKDGDKNKDVET
jgi:hypothetical protein